MNSEYTNKTLILFDGVCNSCNSFVQFLLDQDVERHFVFSSLQSPTGQKMLKRHNLTHVGLTTLVAIRGEEVYTESTAVFFIFSNLPWPWKAVSGFSWLPTRLTDTGYRIFSRNRYRWFGKSSQCRIPSAEERKRFLE